MRNTKKIFFIKIIIFISILVVIDATTGRVTRYFFFKQKSGKYYRITKSFEKVNDSILIMGSSHAINHFYPEIIEKETGQTCYNAGVEGQRLLFVQVLQEIILKRYNPKVLVLCIEPYYLTKFSRVYNLIVDLYPYYYRYPDVIGEVAELRSPYEKFKLTSILYQYNSSIAHIIYYLFNTQKDYKGFVPLDGEVPIYQLKYDPEKDKAAFEREILDDNFILAFKRFITLSKQANSKLIFVMSPIIRKSDISMSKSFSLIKKIAEENNVPILNYYNSPLFVGEVELFSAATHLNIKGAKKFSEVFSDDLNRLLNE